MSLLIYNSLLIDRYDDLSLYEDPKFGIEEVDMVRDEFFNSLQGFIENEAKITYDSLSTEHGKEIMNTIFIESVIPCFKRKWYENLFKLDEPYFNISTIEFTSYEKIRFVINFKIDYSKLYRRIYKTYGYKKLIR